MDWTNKEFGQRLRAAREGRRVKAKDFAAAMGISKGYLSNLEHGNKEPYARWIKQVTELLRVPATYFLLITHKLEIDSTEPFALAPPAPAAEPSALTPQSHQAAEVESEQRAEEVAKILKLEAAAPKVLAGRSKPPSPPAETRNKRPNRGGARKGKASISGHKGSR